ncbi:hypothetical protein B0H17DRAFT_344376 [Mycena rosella]|uniref:Uncharacterized protein n=1 Tax=Mycena rosella TaxID=1033263 RepID=A0AAD7CR26_MYCRO|nr:hypothetical protein B0H17DRAFT_344376 [Mycena rosella]
MASTWLALSPEQRASLAVELHQNPTAILDALRAPAPAVQTPRPQTTPTPAPVSQKYFSVIGLWSNHEPLHLLHRVPFALSPCVHYAHWALRATSALLGVLSASRESAYYGLTGAGAGMVLRMSKDPGAPALADGDDIEATVPGVRGHRCFYIHFGPTVPYPRTNGWKPSEAIRVSEYRRAVALSNTDPARRPHERSPHRPIRAPLRRIRATRSRRGARARMGPRYPRCYIRQYLSRVRRRRAGYRLHVPFPGRPQRPQKYHLCYCRAAACPRRSGRRALCAEHGGKCRRVGDRPGGRTTSSKAAVGKP